MTSLLSAVVQFIRRLAIRLRGVPASASWHLGRNLRCRRGWRNGHTGHVGAGEGLRLEDGVVLDAWGGGIRLGRYVFIGPYTVVYGHGGVIIGDACLIAMHCRILSSNHAVPPLGTDIRSQPDILRPTRIGRDVWLGAGVTVLGGVTIGDGCVVGAGAVVTRDLPAGAIAHGIPATIKGWRNGSPHT